MAIDSIEPSEHVIQSDFVRWSLAYSPKIPALRNLYAIPNGGHRSISTARKLKAEGVKPGVPDLFLAISALGKHGLYLEFKTKKGALRKEQKEWHERLRRAGYLVIVVRSFEEARDKTLAYINCQGITPPITNEI